jgi:regulator of replication initiation timing
MDHIFEQKLVRENHQLQFELAKLNKQIKQLQEKVVGYEQMFNQLSVQEGTEANLNRMKDAAFRGARKAVLAGREAHELNKEQQDIHSAQGRVAASAFQTAVSGIRQRINTQGTAGQEKAAAIMGRYGSPNNPDRDSPLGIAMRKRTASLDTRAGRVAGEIAAGKITGADTSKLKVQQLNIASARARSLFGNSRSPKPTT